VNRKLSDIMTDFSVLRSHLTGTLTTPGDTGYTAGVDSTIRHRPDAVVRAASAAIVVETGRFAQPGDHQGPMRDRFHHPNRPVGS
jgi:hypothetical protein